MSQEGLPLAQIVNGLKSLCNPDYFGISSVCQQLASDFDVIVVKIEDNLVGRKEATRDWAAFYRMAYGVEPSRLLFEQHADDAINKTHRAINQLRSEGDEDKVKVASAALHGLQAYRKNISAHF